MKNLCLYDMPLNQLHSELKETGKVTCSECSRQITSMKDLRINDFGHLRDVCPRSEGFSSLTIDSIMEIVETGKYVKVPDCKIMQSLYLSKTTFIMPDDDDPYVIQSHPYYGAEFSSPSYFSFRFTKLEFITRVEEIIRLFNLFRWEDENDNI